MSRHHVGEKTHGECDWADEEGDKLDRDDDGQNPPWHAGGDEDAEEFCAVIDEAEDNNHEEHAKRESAGDGQMACIGEGVWEEAEDIPHQDKYEYGEDEGEVFASLCADIIADHFGNEFIEEFGKDLHPAGDKLTLAHGDGEEHGGENNAKHHPKGGVREGKINAARVKCDFFFNNELFYWVSHAIRCPA